MTKYGGLGLVVEFEGDLIGQLVQFGAFGSSRAQIDASAYNEDWKDYVLGQQDGDELPFGVAYDPVDGGHAAILASYNDDPNAVVVLNASHADSGLDVDIYCRITALNRASELDGLLLMSGTLKIVEPGVVDAS